MQKSNLKISIITPSYNQGNYIEDAIRSVEQQDFANVEHIIIDNCSTDNTLQILQKHSHLKWISEADKGQSDALNKGFKMATGDIIGWLNADDYYLPNALDEVGKAFTKYHNADLVYGNWNFIDKEGNFIKKSQLFPFDYRMLIYFGPYIGSTALFFRRSIIEQKHFIHPNFRYVMDWEWYARLGKAGKKFHFINKTLAAFRLHGDNQSHNYQSKSGIEGFLKRGFAIAEGQSVIRYYGHHWGKDLMGNLPEIISFRALWWYYRIKCGLKKAFYLYFRKES